MGGLSRLGYGRGRRCVRVSGVSGVMGSARSEGCGGRVDWGCKWVVETAGDKKG